MAKEKETKKSTRRLSLTPLKFEEALSDILNVKPEPKVESKEEQKPEKKQGN